MKIVYRGMAMTLAALTLAGSALAAPVETVLYRFTGFPAEGSSPPAGLIADKQGALYGTTRLGGTSGGVEGFGTVFKLTPPAKGQTAWTETVLYNFTGDGFSPRAGLIADNSGALYGTTEGGGTKNGRGGVGTVFKLTPPATGQTVWTETVLHSFTGNFNGGSDGSNPVAGLIAGKQGALYSTTFFGGNRSENGTVFKLTLCEKDMDHEIAVHHEIDHDHDGCPAFLFEE
jgi:hypothetical protein